MPFRAALLAATLASGPAVADTPLIEVWKTPTCGCCAAWVQRMEAAGFALHAQDVDQGALYRLKARLGLTPETASCHTAMAEGYVLEGHVPAQDVARLLETRPEARGLAVPGMPIGSPGMEMGDTREPFATLLLREDGQTEIFAAHP
jgi:hypothetical protein